MLSPDQIDSLKSSQNSNPSPSQSMDSDSFAQWAQPSKSTNSDTFSNSLGVKGIKGFADYSNNVLKSTAQPLIDAAGNVTKHITESANNIKNPLSDGVDVAGDLAGGVTGAMGGTINAGVVKPIADVASSIPGMDTIANSKYSVASGLLDNLDSAGKYLADKWNQIATSHPEVAQKVVDAGNIAKFMLLFAGDNPELQKSAGTVASAVKQSAIDTAGKVGNVAGKTADTVGNVASKVADTVNTAKDTVASSKVGQAIKPTLSPEEATGHITQGNTESNPAAYRTLSSLPEAGEKSVADIKTNIDTQIPKLAKEVDAEFAKDKTGGHSIKSFETTVGEGKSSVKVNYVQQAIDQLKAHYTAINDAKGLSDMKVLENKAKTTGLTYGDINDLARTHGKDISAFLDNGKAASGLSKQAAENTRMGLKDTARSGLQTEDAKALDSLLSDHYDTKALIDKQVETVNKSNNKTTPQGVIPKVIGKGVKLIDTVTGGPLKAIGKAMGNSNSSATMSPTEIDSNIAKYLKIIRNN